MAERGRRVLRAALAVLAVAVVLAAAAALYLRHRLLGSLPVVDGALPLPGLARPVRIERDRLGIPRITGESRADVARGLGFVHGQDRFFQMDLTRRRSAGELAEIAGPAALPLDRRVRVHRFRDVARRSLAAAAAAERALAEAYADGVNAGLRSLGAPPPEYLALRTEPAPWRAEDCLLANLAMFVTLQDILPEREAARETLRASVPAPLFAFLAPDGTEWDAPLVGPALLPPPVPGREVYDLRTVPPPAAAEHPAAQGRSGDESEALRWALAPEPPGAERFAGSNNWAVSGAHTASGHALLADDMHLPLGLPNTWYRASLRWPEAGGTAEVTGVTLPGAPAVVVGSNGHVAWGFTSSEADWADLVVLEAEPSSGPDAYRTPSGPRTIERLHETLRVKGGAEETLEIEQSVWGPVVARDAEGRRRALRWTAHDPEAVNLALVGLESVRTLPEALDAAALAGAPGQNFVAADAEGHIGWTLLGRIPRRIGLDGRLPSSWADGTRRWDGYLAPAEYPRVVDPPEGRLWTANARTVDGAMLAKLGFGAYDLGARAKQIRDRLRALEGATERDLLAVQLDDRALFLSRWRELLLRTLTAEALAGHPERGDFRAFASLWGDRARPDSVGYRLVRAFRAKVADQLMSALTAAARARDPKFEWNRLGQWEGPVWALVVERPAHLLPPGSPSWDAQLLAAVDAVIADLRPLGPLRERTWGEQNAALFLHPLSPALPRWMRRHVDLPPRPLPGDANLPRVLAPRHGASERMVVSPGREAEAILHMPGGQSGHFLSPHYHDQLDAWAEGTPTPFLPGPPEHTLVLQPAASAPVR